MKFLTTQIRGNPTLNFTEVKRSLSLFQQETNSTGWLTKKVNESTLIIDYDRSISNMEIKLLNY